MKDCEKIIYSTPGKLMLIGEHAVLHNKKCIAIAIDKRIKAELRKSDDSKVTVYSDLGTYSISISDLHKIKIDEVPADFKFVIMVLKKAKINSGIQLIINSDFPPTFGLGSSASVVVATVAVVRDFLGLNMDLKDENILKEIFDESYDVFSTVQNNKGSGYDIAVAIWGGIIEYNKEPFSVEKLGDGKDFPISVIYCGYKTKTTDVLDILKEKSKGFKEEYDKIYQVIDGLNEKAKKFIKEKNWKELGKVFNINQGLLDAIGVNDKTLSEIIYWARENGAYGSKISGAGLGDCAIAIGELPLYEDNKNPKIQSLALKVTEFGLRNE